MRLASERIVAEVLPEHGMTITALAPRHGGPNVLWERSGHVPPACSRELGPTGAGSLETLHDLLVGGWFEMSPHAGLPGELDARPTLLHGEASRLPWQVVSEGETWVEATVGTVHGSLELRRRIELDGDSVAVRSTIHNAGSVPASIAHGEHPCFSRAVFAGGTLTLDAGEASVLPALDPANASLAEGDLAWPHARGRDGALVDLSTIPADADGSHDHVSIRLAGPRVGVRTRDGLHVTLHVDLGSHPYLLLWRNHRAPSSPGLGTWDVFALEPMSAPGRAIDDAVRSGCVRRLAPGERAAYDLAISVEPP
ncbi:MAG: hypothetical protein WBC33_02585, partial [Conexibacter sp.]